MADYEIVLDYSRGETHHPLDQEIEVKLRDPNTFETTSARVIISEENLDSKDTIQYVSAIGGREPTVFSVQLLEMKPEETEEVNVLPKAKLTLGQRKGTMLADMIRAKKNK